MRRATGLLIVAALAFLGGCGPATQPLGGQARSKVYNAVVSLSPSTTELLSTTQVLNEGRFKGRTAADNYPKAQFSHVPIVASVKPDYEKIAGIKPDLVCYDKDLYGPADVEKIKQLGADVFVLDATTVEQLISELYAMGNMIGGETNVSDYVDRITAAMAATSGMTVHPKVAILMPGDGGNNMIDGVDSFQADIVKVSGGVPVGPKGSLFVPLDPEVLLSLNPDYIITSGAPNAILSDPRFKALKAVAGNKFIPINSDVLLRRGARVDMLITAVHNAIAK